MTWSNRATEQVAGLLAQHAGVRLDLMESVNSIGHGLTFEESISEARNCLQAVVLGARADYVEDKQSADHFEAGVAAIGDLDSVDWRQLAEAVLIGVVTNTDPFS